MEQSENGNKRKITLAHWLIPHDPVFMISNTTSNNEKTMARHHAVHSQPRPKFPLPRTIYCTEILEREVNGLQ